MECIGSAIEIKSNRSRSVSWKSEGQGSVSQGSLIWCLIIWIRAADWLTFLTNLSSVLRLAKAWAKSGALIGRNQLLFKACHAPNLWFSIYISLPIACVRILTKSNRCKSKKMKSGKFSNLRLRCKFGV